jgi:hypothetical protein
MLIITVLIILLGPQISTNSGGYLWNKSDMKQNKLTSYYKCAGKIKILLAKFC